MASRLKLQEELENLLGNNNVYFQPPESLRMSYPCIRYELRGANPFRADNTAYTIHRSYSVVHIYKDPDEDLINEFLDTFQMCDHDRHYTSDGLNHDVYTIFF